jgi:hypothetical protein
MKERDAERTEQVKLEAERDRLQSLYEHAHHLLRKANDHRFGARNERLERRRPTSSRREHWGVLDEPAGRAR